MKYFSSIVVTLLILVTVSIPGSKIPGTGFSGLDKIAHVIMFYTWSMALQFDTSTRTRWTKILITGVVFGLGTEFLQLQLKNRSFDWLDWLFDSIGLVLAALTSAYLLPVLERFWPWTLLKRFKNS